MNIAIMGAGISGLTCAITLEKYGIHPTIFEKRGRVGDRFINGEIMMSMLSRPIYNHIGHLAEQYGIYLKPASNIQKLIIYSENEQATINGHIGFINYRGRHQKSYESQLAEQLESKIIFNSKKTYEELTQEYTHVILATGDAAYSTKLQDYHVDLTVTMKGATVEGEFERSTVVAWLNYDFAPLGYSYLIPYSKTEANIVIAFPDYPTNQTKDLNHLWQLFYNQVCQSLQQDLQITDQFEITRYIIGHAQYPRIGNTFFVGNCFGSIMPFLGFGQFAALLTGIYAAKDLCGMGNYENLLNHIQESYQSSLTLRRLMEQLDNSKLDFLVRRLNGTLGQQLFVKSRGNPLRLFSHLINPWISLTSTTKN